MKHVGFCRKISYRPKCFGWFKQLNDDRNRKQNIKYKSYKRNRFSSSSVTPKVQSHFVIFSCKKGLLFNKSIVWIPIEMTGSFLQKFGEQW